MIVQILKKCLDELSKESPKLDYVRGMLETLIETQPITGGSAGSFTAAPVPSFIPTGHNATTDEGSILDATAAAKIAKIKGMSEQSS